VTALIPRLGHARAVALAQRMRDGGLGVRAAVRELGLLSDAELDDLLNPERLCALGWRKD
jgi:aspartate ammonia-lyase